MLDGFDDFSDYDGSLYDILIGIVFLVGLFTIFGKILPKIIDYFWEHIRTFSNKKK